MNGKIMRTVVAIAALGALALGGSALAQAGGSDNSAPASQTQPAVESQSGPDTDTVQEGDQSGNEKADESGTESESGPDTDSVQEGGQSGNEKADESGTEVPGDDGPGGHADEVVK